MAELSEKPKTIKLYGVLGKRFGRVHYLVVNSTSEALRALCVMIPGFEKYLTTSKDRGLTYSVFIGSDNIEKTHLDFPVGDDPIRIAPITFGSKRAGIFQTILGAALIVASFWAGPMAPMLLAMGSGMFFGGVASLLSPQTKGLSSNDGPNNQASYAFNGAVNTSAQGNPVPVFYGEGFCGSAIISAGIFAEDQ